MKREVLLGIAGVGILSLITLLSRRPPPPVVVDPPVSVQIDPLPKFYVAEPKIIKPPVRLSGKPHILAPHEKRGFGSDTARNVDDYTADDYMNLPLIGTGKTYANESAYKDLEDETTMLDTPIKRFKYIRLVVTGVRKGHTVEIGGVRFFHGRSMNYHTNLTTWNPHTGDRASYDSAPWSDNDQRTIVFCFKEAAEVNRYEIKTSSGSTDHDPIHWKLEGSVSGTYWIPLDDRTMSFPVQRDIWIMYVMNRV